MVVIDAFHNEYGRGNTLLCACNGFLDLFHPYRHPLWLDITRRVLDLFGVSQRVTALQFAAYRSGTTIFHIFELIQLHYHGFNNLFKLIFQHKISNFTFFWLYRQITLEMIQHLALSFLSEAVLL